MEALSPTFIPFTRSAGSGEDQHEPTPGRECVAQPQIHRDTGLCTGSPSCLCPGLHPGPRSKAHPKSTGTQACAQERGAPQIHEDTHLRTGLHHGSRSEAHLKSEGTHACAQGLPPRPPSQASTQAVPCSDSWKSALSQSDPHQTEAVSPHPEKHHSLMFKLSRKCRRNSSGSPLISARSHPLLGARRHAGSEQSGQTGRDTPGQQPPARAAHVWLHMKWMLSGCQGIGGGNNGSGC